MNERPAWYYRQSAVIPYREGAAGLEILLITSRKSKRWIVPKGVVELHLSATASAAKEALEEAGVRGEVISEPLGSYRYDKWGGTCTVEVFPLRVEREESDWPERTFRTRRWLPAHEAAEIVDDEPVARMIKFLSKQLESVG